MKEEQFQRLIRLARSTGSPLIVADGSDEGIVILPVSQYEALVETGSSDVKPQRRVEEMPAPPPAPSMPSAEPTPPDPIPEPPPEVEAQFYLEPVE